MQRERGGGERVGRGKGETERETTHRNVPHFFLFLKNIATGNDIMFIYSFVIGKHAKQDEEDIRESENDRRPGGGGGSGGGGRGGGLGFGLRFMVRVKVRARVRVTVLGEGVNLCSF